MTTRLDEIEREYQSNFTRISSEFTTINATVQVLVSNMVQHNVDSMLAQRTQSVSDESDQANQLEASSQSETSYASSSSGSPSSNSSFFENVETHFKEVFNLLRGDDSVDYMCETVACEIRQLTGKKVGGATIISFYYGYSDSKYSTIKLISKWLDSKTE